MFKTEKWLLYGAGLILVFASLLSGCANRESVLPIIVQKTAVYPVAGSDVADELEKFCFPDAGQCRGLEDFFSRYEKAVDAYESNG